MPKIDTRLSISAPAEINVPLVRADHLSTSNIFRAVFEVFLSLSSAIVGVVLSIEKVTNLHWAFLSVTGVAALVFLCLSVWFGRRARSGG